MINPQKRHEKLKSGGTFCTTFLVTYSGRSAVRLAHLLWEQGVEGSNPFTPTGLTSGQIDGFVRSLHF